MLSNIIRTKYLMQLTNNSLCRISNPSDLFFSQKHLTQKESEVEEQQKSGTKKIKKFKLQDIVDVKIPDINPVKKINYAFERDAVKTIPRQIYVPPVKKSVKLKIQKQEYDKFMQAVLEEKVKTNEEKIDVSQNIWGNEEKPIRYLSKTGSKELYFNYREQNFVETIKMKNSYLYMLQEPHTVINKDISDNLNKIKEKSLEALQKVYDPNYFIEEDFYLQNNETKTLFKQLSQQLINISYQEIPQICMVLGLDLRYKIDVFKIWDQIEKMIENHIHNYTVEQLIQIKYSAAATFPKAFSNVTHNKLLQIIENEVEQMSVDELMHVLVAFRLLQNENLSDKIINILKQKLNEYQDDSNKLVEVLYSILNNQPKKHLRKRTIDYDSDKKKRQGLIQLFIDPIKQGAHLLTPDNLTRLSLSIQLIRLQNFDDVFLYIETHVLQKLDQFNEFHLGQILYSFSKGNNGNSVGSNEFYVKISQKLPKFWNKWNNLTKSRIFYAYCANNIIIEKDQNNLYLPWISKEMENFQYSELQNVAYGLMFTKNLSQEIWRQFARNIGYQKEIVPLVNFYAIKQAYYYIMYNFQQWDLEHIRAACFEAENQFNVLRLQKSSYNDQLIEFNVLLQDLFEFEWKNFYNFDNLYLLGAVIPVHRIALILQTNKNSLPDGRVRPQILLQKQILEFQEWNVTIIKYDDLFNRQTQEHKPYLEKIINEALKNQKPKVQKWEEERRQEIYNKLYMIGQARTTQGLPTVKAGDFDQLERKV